MRETPSHTHAYKQTWATAAATAAALAAAAALPQNPNSDPLLFPRIRLNHVQHLGALNSRSPLHTRARAHTYAQARAHAQLRTESLFTQRFSRSHSPTTRLCALTGLI